MKKFKDLRESLADTGTATGTVTDIIGPAEIRNIKELAYQMNLTFQVDMPHALHKLELELNKYGYTMGDLDLEEGFDASGEEDFLILSYSTKELIRNCYLTLEWKEMAAGIVIPTAGHAGALSYWCQITVNEVSPAEFEAMFSDEDVEDDGEAYVGDTLTGGPSGEYDEMDESVQIDETVKFMVEGKEYSYSKTDAEALVESIMDQLLPKTE